jgi:ParB-like chromosome segregation protein Spo0J
MQLYKIKDVKLNPSNPRIIKDDKFAKLVESLKEFPEMATIRPIVCNTDMVILGGNMRFKAMQAAGWKEVPVEVVDWPEDKQAEFVIKDNVSGGEWDWDMLANQWDAEKLEAWGLDLPDLTQDEKYTSKIESPVYEPKRNKPDISELIDVSKAKQLQEAINKSNAPDEVKYFLTLASYRHVVFNFENIAEFYCHESTEVQELMEQSALVIIDFGKAIEQGFVVLSDKLTKLYTEDHEE